MVKELLKLLGEDVYTDFTNVVNWMSDHGYTVIHAMWGWELLKDNKNFKTFKTITDLHDYVRKNLIE